MQDHKPSWLYGLERPADLQQNDYTSSLELAKSHHQEKTPQVYVHTLLPPPAPPTLINPPYIHHELASPKPQQPESRTCGLRRSRFWLFAVLTAFVVATIIAASVAGALISQKRHAAARQETPPLPAPATTSPSTNTTTLPPPSSALLIPTSSCPTLHKNTTYILPASPSSSLPHATNFSIQCATDYKLPLIMAMRTYRFEDCLQACATHAANAGGAGDGGGGCTVAVYKPDSGQSITCWLKGKGEEEGRVGGVVGVDSARIVG
ncbi:MAG: hypothetical protein LQ350_006861 [Teloschistes chrysophthalmus]|nr:MAG: hypothetical protein LQ350_006861 [Niorma chrysophthalma]